jgi:hypothetical protein
MRKTKALAVAAVAALLIVGGALPALAAGSGGSQPKGTHLHRNHHNNKPPVAGTTLTRGAPETQVAGESASGSVLPFTGAQLTLFVLVGLAAIGTGSAMVVRSRRMGWRRALVP